MDDAENEQGSNLNVSDIELESDQESETKSSDSDDIVLADCNRSTDNVRDINIFAFSGPQPGPTQTLEANKKELDFLNLLFPEKSYLKISEETLMRMLNSASDLKQILNGTTQPLGIYVLFLDVKSLWGLLVHLHKIFTSQRTNYFICHVLKRDLPGQDLKTFRGISIWPTLNKEPTKEPAWA